LSEAENRNRVLNTINVLRAKAKAKQEAVDYWETHGSLAGFRGSSRFDGMSLQKEPTGSMKQMNEVIKEYKGKKYRYKRDSTGKLKLQGPA
jgi:hypothetical protein